MAGELVYYRRFARRVPDPKLEKSTTSVLWGLPIASALVVLGGTIIGVSALLAGRGAGPAASAPMEPSGAALAGGTALVCAGLVATLVLGLWYIRLLIAYRKAFLQAREYAAQLDAENGNEGTRGNNAR